MSSECVHFVFTFLTSYYIIIIIFCSGLAVAEYLSEHNVLENVRARGEQLASGLKDITSRYPSVLGETRGWGLLRGVAIKEDADRFLNDH